MCCLAHVRLCSSPGPVPVRSSICVPSISWALGVNHSPPPSGSFLCDWNPAPVPRGLLSCPTCALPWPPGGRQSKYAVNAFEVFDIETRSWTKFPNIPCKRAFSSFVTLDDRLYSLDMSS